MLSAFHFQSRFLADNMTTTNLSVSDAQIINCGTGIYLRPSYHKCAASRFRRMRPRLKITRAKSRRCSQDE
jgi:hypothetical protein